MKRDLTQYALLHVEHSTFHEGRPAIYLTMPIICGPSNPHGVIRELNPDDPKDRDILWQLEKEASRARSVKK